MVVRQELEMSFSEPSQLQRYSSSHSTSSAFSASAQPHEDWTKISDLAERRRIQNRIAQRNYRKKIRRRLEDLEKRASTSPSPDHTEQDGQGGARPPARRNTGPRRQSIKRDATTPASRKHRPESIITPYTAVSDSSIDHSAYAQRHHSDSPPLVTSYSCPTSGPATSSFYQAQPTFSSLHAPSTGSFPEYADPLPYLQPLPTTLPSMSPFDPSPIKQSHFFEDATNLSQYGMPYTSFSGIELPLQASYQDSSINTPPLSHSRSLDRSRDASPSSQFPTTPISVSSSPPVTFGYGPDPMVEKV